MLCEHAANQENSASWCYKALLKETFIYILAVFGYLSPMGFVPEFCLIKSLCSLGNWGIRYEEANGYVELDAKSKKAMHLINLIKQCKELASIAQVPASLLGGG